MTRNGLLTMTIVAACFVAGTACFEPSPRVVWNATASAPIGLYVVSPGQSVHVGDLALAMPDASLGAWLARRHYVPLGVPLIKPIAATARQKVCREGATISIDGRSVAYARNRDRGGRLLPAWAGCRTLKRDELLLLNPKVADSLDGRYFGPTPTGEVIGTVRPLFTRDRPDGALIWRGWRS